MAKAVAIYTGGIHNLREVAVREDGLVFSRYQSRGMYGYTWSKWRSNGEKVDVNNLDSERSAGFDTLRRQYPNSANINGSAMFDKTGKIRVRLPN